MSGKCMEFTTIKAGNEHKNEYINDSKLIN